MCHNKNSSKVPLFFKHHSFFVVDMVWEELHLIEVSRSVGILSRPKQGSSYDTNPNHALLTGNPSKLPYIRIKFNDPCQTYPTLKICQETWPRFWWSHVIHMKPPVEIQRVSLNIITLSLFIEGLGFGLV